MPPIVKVVTGLLLSLTTLTIVLASSSPKSTVGPPLPHRDQDWQTIREKNLLYVDKSLFVVKLLETSRKLCFLTRPRRFGKSMFVDMMADFFRGVQDKFKGLAVAKTGNTKYFAERMPKNAFRKLYCKIGQLFCPDFSPFPKWTEFPVVYLNFAELTNFDTPDAFEKIYRQRLGEILDSYKIETEKWSSLDTSAVIKALHRKFEGLPVIVLVDEYDYPFQYALNTLKRANVAAAIRTYLDGIFVQIKNNVRNLGLAFVTGVSKLGLPALESGGDNAFVDLTLDRDFAVAFGLSADEIEANLKPHVREFARLTNLTTAARGENGTEAAEQRIMKRLEKWYDGYSFSLNVTKASKVLNPISTMDSLRNHKFDNYWCSADSIDLLVEKFYEKQSVWRVDSFKQGVAIQQSKLFQRHDRLKGEIPLPAWMLLSGYATIARYDDRGSDDDGLVTLRYPNYEVEETVQESVAEYVPSKKKYIGECKKENELLYEEMSQGNFRAAFEAMRDYEFVPLAHRSRDGAMPAEMRRRLRKIFSGARIECREGVAFKHGGEATGGSIDFLTLNLEKNCAISIKYDYGGTAMDAIGQLIGYTSETSRESLAKAVKEQGVNPEALYLIGIGFTYNDEGPKLQDWIALPYVNGKLQYKRARADLEALKETFLEKYAPDRNSSKKA